jgi:hypothetical protein
VLALLVGAFCLPACSSDKNVAPIPLGGGSGQAGGGPTDVGEPKVARSPKSLVRFKGGERLRNDLAATLALADDEVCTELGRLSCVDDVHKVTLGGVDAYASQVFRPSPSTGATTPSAVERVALSACAKRSRRDFADPTQALVWSGLGVDARGNVSDPAGAAPGQAVARLYQRAFGREPTSAEREQLTGFYERVLAEKPEGAAEAWATLACFATLTSLEFLFY